MYIVHNYDIKHQSIFHSRNWRMTIQNRVQKLTDAVNSVQYSLSETLINYHSSRSADTKQGKQSFQSLPVVVQEE